MKIKRIIDISRRIKPGMTVWPGDSGVNFYSKSSIKDGDVCNVTGVDMGLHTGTHIDAPLHFFDPLHDIASLDLSLYIGYVNVFELDVRECITEEDIKGLDIQKGDVVFFKTGNSQISEEKEFDKDYIYLDKSASEFLFKKGVKTLGIDYLSIDGYYSEGFHSHNILLSNGIGVIEGLCLKDVKPGRYFFSCLPLKIEGADGSPVRGVLLELE
ncbi:MAG TPA: cyclase family protein [Pseudobacteroides sp.]|uniref:cyclase family protein n=1 Tax=Pseudobacteroides sp. TaxID=1968840 RepID=UPI002F93F955